MSHCLVVVDVSNLTSGLLLPLGLLREHPSFIPFLIATILSVWVFETAESLLLSLFSHVDISGQLRVVFIEVVVAAVRRTHQFGREVLVHLRRLHLVH